MTARPILPLTVAGSDPSGGAGLQADLKVFAAFGLSGAAVPTAWTVQGPSGVFECRALDADLVERQLQVVLDELPPDVIKVGMLGDAAVVGVVAALLAPLAASGTPVVVDPVLVSSSGERLLPESALDAFRELLVPVATVLTPNLDEALQLTGRDPNLDMEGVIADLRAAGAGTVVVTGGHGVGDEVVDVIGGAAGLRRLAGPRMPGGEVHGTGCAFASAVAAGLATGSDVEGAVRRAKAAVARAVEGAWSPRSGARQLDFAAMG